MPEYRRYATVLAVFSAVAYVAFVVCAFGLLSLFTDTEVIDDPSVGPLAGPVMVAISAVVVGVCLIAIGRSVPPEKQRVSVPVALGVGLAAYLGYIFFGGALFGAGTGDAFGVLSLAFRLFASPYAIAVGILAAVVALLYSLILLARGRRGRRPMWPWERDEDEPPSP